MQEAQKVRVQGLIEIPDELKILPTDTAAEVERKKKRIRAIKSQNRHKTKDLESNTKQSVGVLFSAQRPLLRFHLGRSVVRVAW